MAIEVSLTYGTAPEVLGKKFEEQQAIRVRSLAAPVMVLSYEVTRLYGIPEKSKKNSGKLVGQQTMGVFFAKEVTPAYGTHPKCLYVRLRMGSTGVRMCSVPCRSTLYR